MHSIKRSGYRMENKFDKGRLEQSNYLNKIVNVYIVYNLDVWPRNTNNNTTVLESLSNKG